MPNHVRNRIRATQTAIDLLCDDEGSVDFNRLIPQPACISKPMESRDGIAAHIKNLAEIALGVVDLSMPTVGIRETPDIRTVADNLHKGNCVKLLTEWRNLAKDFSDEDFELFVDLMRSYRECGYLDWYDWNSAHWGTKWNAYDSRRIRGGIEFDTAWAAPHPVIEKLAEVYGGEIVHEWADEDTGHNCGRREYCVGNLVVTFEPEGGSHDAYELAFCLRPGVRECYVKTPTGYEYREPASA